MENFPDRIGFTFFLGALYFLSYFRHDWKYLGVSVILFLHLIFGKFKWFGRYEIYCQCFFLLSLIQIHKVLLTNFFRKKKTPFVFLVISPIVAVLFFPYFCWLVAIPVASNNIYDQQYQMHRFILENYKKPVAGNDIGWISYMNSNYVLDLCGLSSEKALKGRCFDSSNKWMEELTRENNVELAMIYEDWFDKIPHKWKKIAKLYLSRPVGLIEEPVSFYSINPGNQEALVKQLLEFRNTLPEKVRLEILKES
ncbi:MAG: hypothetical protein HQM08_13055 [Candidatus Riflebacteria bacterium]|nr:hypothetical protein [Candidatus Riflebacteria bacterium]